jgi:hypothetical protein
MSEEILSTMPVEEPTAEELEQHFSAMSDSVWVIDSLAESPREGQSAEEASAEIQRNVAHLALMIEKPYIKSAGRSLSAYIDAIKKGSK